VWSWEHLCARDYARRTQHPLLDGSYSGTRESRPFEATFIVLRRVTRFGMVPRPFREHAAIVSRLEAASFTVLRSGFRIWSVFNLASRCEFTSSLRSITFIISYLPAIFIQLYFFCSRNFSLLVYCLVLHVSHALLYTSCNAVPFLNYLAFYDTFLLSSHNCSSHSIQAIIFEIPYHF
jgi:hypothetical protein